MCVCTRACVLAATIYYHLLPYWRMAGLAWAVLTCGLSCICSHMTPSARLETHANVFHFQTQHLGWLDGSAGGRVGEDAVWAASPDV